jgi:ribosome-associated translation inhibitor RaiA
MEADIRRRAARLGLYYDRIMACRVAIEVPHRRHRTGSACVARIDLTVPGAELVIKRQPGDAFETAIQDAFAAARRRLQDYIRRRRAGVKAKGGFSATSASPQTAHATLGGDRSRSVP